ncbi:MAG: histone deacetylase family protein [Candidatus Saccharibacteria bacterium]|nr:histone deacetylase family protein [Candidatus Saccharibacteria bacterium]
MLVIYDPTHLLHNPTTELYDGVATPSPETPDRIETIKKSLEELLQLCWKNPDNFSDEEALTLHSKPYIEYLRESSSRLVKGQECVTSNFIHDTYAPISNGTWAAARSALNTALTGAQSLLQGDDNAVYVLCRPPGHHAGDAYMGGYCFFNNAGAAANYLSAHGRVAILDIDYHHGNGTQQLFYERSDVLYVSIHANPANQYPYTNGFEAETGLGKGLGFNKNIVVEKYCGWDIYSHAFTEALEAVTQFKPDYLVVSLGFDGYKDDPIAGFGLSIENFGQISSEIKKLGLPTLLVQEGGYCIEALGDLAKEIVENLS